MTPSVGRQKMSISLQTGPASNCERIFIFDESLRKVHPRCIYLHTYFGLIKLTQAVVAIFYRVDLTTCVLQSLYCVARLIKYIDNCKKCLPTYEILNQIEEWPIKRFASCYRGLIFKNFLV
jgi:hypothetical protein